MELYSDEYIIEGIRSRDHDVLKYAYEQYYPMVRYLIIRNHGNDLDAEDTFQEAMVAIFEKARSNKLKLNCSFKTYIYSVCRNLWLQQLERDRSFLNFEDHEKLLASEELILYEDENRLRKKIFQKHFLELTEKCRRILLMFIENIAFDEIARLMGLKNKHYAIKRKYECIRSLILRIHNDPEYKRSLK
jgi:RNA polymerase sigma factor (sigma-70 family)